MTEPDCRIFRCARCSQEVVICRRCDHGNRYCVPCAPLARTEKRRTAGAVYQKTETGRLHHKVRQEQYRARLAEKVTHHGDLRTAVGPDLAVAALLRGQESPDERREDSPKPPELSPPPPRRCDFCGRPCPCAVRTTTWLVRLRSIHRRGPRLPGHAGLGQRR